MINKKYFKKIAVAVMAAALLFQVQPAIAADVFDGEETAAVETQDLDTAEAAVEETGSTEETDSGAVPVEVQPIEIAPIEIDPVNIDIPETEEPAAEEVQPEEIVPDQEETAEEPAAEENAETETTESEELLQEAPEYKTDFQFENDEVKIIATASEEAKLPQNTEMRAVKLEEGTAAYEEAKAASAEKLGTGEDADYCFYDVTFVADGQELSPEKGTVSIQMEFKNIQIDASAQAQNVVHIEDTENGRQVQDVTSVAQDGSNLQSIDFAM